MEQTKDITAMLDLMLRPAFSVKDGKVDHLNHAAACLSLAAGTPVSELLLTGTQEYSEMTEGCLYLNISICGHSCGASVTKMDSADIFLLEQQNELSQLQSMALAARELREPLANIMVAADRLLPTLEESGDEGSRQQAARINRSLHQMLRLVSNMSDASRYSTEPEPRMELQNFSAVTEEIFERAAELLEHSGTALRFKGLREDVCCLMDAERVERAIYNLISNAVKFSPSGSTVDAVLTRRADKLYLTVQDSGSGIAPSIQGSIYSRYLRQPAIEDSRHGIGLGMVMVRAAAAAHGGTVLMEQLPSKGTRITVTFAIRKTASFDLRSPRLRVDYTGERDHGLIELSDALPPEAYHNI
ncbi:MAG: HAMP domain-containing histidine kinase [Oscillospiraceae bacterium]|nr:HAMP domain-containing histidine kinase [Oscillospiraceae bacterium]